MAKVGRPTSYSKETHKKAIGYLDSCGEVHEVKERPVVKTDDVGEQRVTEEHYVQSKIILPTVEGLALVLNVHRDTLYEWGSKHPEFSDILDHLKKKQANMLIQYGLTGEYNSVIAKMILSSKHGFIEKTSQDNTLTVVDPEQKKLMESALSDL